MSYVWWALAVIVTAGLTVAARATSPDQAGRTETDPDRQLISDVNVAG
jgi:alpha-1,2-mannosyltransferase